MGVAGKVLELVSLEAAQAGAAEQGPEVVGGGERY